MKVTRKSWTEDFKSQQSLSKQNYADIDNAKIPAKYGLLEGQMNYEII